MATTKVVVEVALTLAHPDGTKLSWAAVKRRIREVLEEQRADDYEVGMQISRGVVRRRVAQ